MKTRHHIVITGGCPLLSLKSYYKWLGYKHNVKQFSEHQYLHVTAADTTIGYLSSGDSITSLQYTFRIPKNTIYIFLPEVLFAIYEVLQPYMKVR